MGMILRAQTRKDGARKLAAIGGTLHGIFRNRERQDGPHIAA